MKSFLVRKSIHIGLFVLMAFIMELITYAFMFQTFKTYLFLDLFLFLFLGAFILFFKNSLFDVIYLPIVLFLIVVLLVANANFFIIFGDVFSLQYFAYIKRGMGVFSFSYINFYRLGIIVGLYLIYLGVMIFLYKFEKKKVLIGKTLFSPKKGLITALSLFLSLGGFVSSYFGVTSYEKQFYQNKVIFENVTMLKNENFETYGLLSYYIREANYLMFGISDEDKKSLNEYFNRPVETDNNFTGSLKGKNVVVIMIETGDDLMVNEYLTPNLYNMLDKGIDGTRNYSKNKTNISEIIGITGSGSTSGMPANQEYYMPFSTPSMLNEEYNTMYFHDTGGEQDIYERKTILPQYGFENCYFHDDIHPDLDMWGWNGSYIRDSITMPNVSDIILKDTSKPFYAFYTSLSMHGPYINSANEEVLQNEYGSKLKEAKEKGLWINPFENDPFEDDKSIDTYMLAAMDFDKGLGIMLDKFKEKGELDDTLFVLYGDHECYYDGREGVALNIKLGGHEDNSLVHPDLYNTVLTFYNEELNEKYEKAYGDTSIHQFSSPYVIVPTILDLLGVKYNANFYMGSSIFAPQFKDTQVFYSIELSSFFNEDFWTYNGHTISEYFSDNVDDEDFLLATQELMQKQAYLDIIYKDNILKDSDFSTYNYR